MNPQGYLKDPFFFIGLAAAAYFAGRRAWRTLESHWLTYVTAQSSRDAAMNNLAAQLARVDLAPLAKVVGDAVETTQKMQAGQIKACEAIAVETSKLRLTTLDFQKMLFGGANGKDALEVPTELDRDRAYSEMQHRAAGKTPEEASALAQQEQESMTASYPSE